MKGKPKKGLSSGLGSGKSSLNAHHHNCSTAKATTIRDRKGIEPKEKVVDDDDTDLNSGFGTYIRSPEAIEMMKLFVMANSIVIILTMAWPNMKEMYTMFEEWLYYKNL